MHFVFYKILYKIQNVATKIFFKRHKRHSSNTVTVNVTQCSTNLKKN